MWPADSLPRVRSVSGAIDVLCRRETKRCTGAKSWDLPLSERARLAGQMMSSGWGSVGPGHECYCCLKPGNQAYSLQLPLPPFVPTRCCSQLIIKPSHRVLEQHLWNQIDHLPNDSFTKLPVLGSDLLRGGGSPQHTFAPGAGNYNGSEKVGGVGEGASSSPSLVFQPGIAPQPSPSPSPAVGPIIASTLANYSHWLPNIKSYCHLLWPDRLCHLGHVARVQEACEVTERGKQH